MVWCGVVGKVVVEVRVCAWASRLLKGRVQAKLEAMTTDLLTNQGDGQIDWFGKSAAYVIAFRTPLST